MELASLQTLGDEKKAGAVPEQGFGQLAAATQKKEQVAAQWVFLEALANERGQAVEPLAHIDRLAVDEDASGA